ncbi:MAG: sodium:proton antiporter [Pseudomonadota bacterium]
MPAWEHMDFWNLLALLLTLTALFGYLNDRWLRQPAVIGIMLLALLFSLLLISLHHLGVDLSRPARALLTQVHFEKTLLHGMLGYLLFAGALQIDVGRLRHSAWVVTALATVGTLLSTLLIGTIAYGTLHWIGLQAPVAACMLLGALISPTDTVAVLAILKHVGAPRTLEIQIAGESLFNDGISLTLFILFFAMTYQNATTSWPAILAIFSREVFGGILLGAALGWGSFYLMQRVGDNTAVILLSLAVASGGFALARQLDVSAPLAMVVAGLVVGHQGRRHALTLAGRDRLDLFWQVVDDILNAILFLLIGLEILALPSHGVYLGAILVLIPVTLIARGISTGLPWLLLRRRHHFDAGALPVLVWGGLRGALSVAMALSLPAGDIRDAIVAITYGIVVFSILVQGTTIRPLIARWMTAPGEH